MDQALAQTTIEIEKQKRIQERLKRLRAIRARVRARNRDLTQDQAEELADVMVREAVESLFAQGKVRYKQEQDELEPHARSA